MSNIVGFNKKPMAVVMRSICRRVDHVKIYKGAGGDVICKDILVEWLDYNTENFMKTIEGY
jgi:hypothetical protein